MYNDHTQPYISIGEMWDPNRQVIQNWMDSTQGASSAFDFATKGILHGAVGGDYGALRNGNGAAGLIGWSPCKSVTFIDNHDTGSTQNHWPFPSDKVMQGYAYIMTHPGIPMIFWDHYFDWGLKSQIDALTAVRKDMGLTCASQLVINEARGGLYAATIDNKVAMKLGGDSWTPSGTGWTMAASGTNYAVWKKASTNNAPVVTANPAGPQTSTSAIAVTVTGTDDSGVAPTLYYTTDGSTPTTSSASAVGTKSFNFATSTTLKVFAKDNLGLESSVQTHQYTINTPVNQAPFVSVNPPGPYTATAAFNVNITATDDSGVAPTLYYTTDGSTPTASSASATGSKQLNIAANTTLKVFATDNMSLSSAVQTHVYTVNIPVNQAPVITNISPDGSQPATAAFNAVVTATDDSGVAPMVKCTKDGSTPTAASPGGTSPYTVNISQTSTLKCIAIDAPGLSSAVVSVNYTVNSSGGNQAPVVTVTPAGPYTAANAFEVAVVATDDSGVAPSVYYTVDGSTPTTASTLLAAGAKIMISATSTLKIYAVDNQSLASAVQSHAYTITPTNAGFSVYFKKPAAWVKSNIYYWNTLPANAQPASANFPGTTMTATCNGWSKFTFESGVTSTGLLFTDGAGRKTVDLTRSKDGWYNGDTNIWSDVDTSGCDGSQQPLTNYIMDGNLDGNLAPLATNDAVNLYAHFNGTRLYVATESAQSRGQDVFIFVSRDPQALQAAMWAKAGQVASNTFILGNESVNNYAGWTNAIKTPTQFAGATHLEGTLDVVQELGTGVRTIFIAVGTYATADGGALMKQVPAAVIANGNVETGEFHALSIPVPTNDNPDVYFPREISLNPNYPNPFDRQTNIPVRLETPGRLFVEVYDMLGRKMTTLHDGMSDSGDHLLALDASGWANGVYFVIMHNEKSREVRKIMIID
jgi:Alpha-amylase C-terminal beta-sheet domain/Starch-binding module 26/Secretion system C-terminal sorting domain/Chitobiase/beta-hexosaminidase C-terminal domain